MGLPEASRDPFWSHFGTLLEPIWSPREPRKSCSRRGGSTFLIKIACSVRTSPSEALRDRFWRHFGAFFDRFSRPRRTHDGPKSRQECPKSRPRGGKKGQKGPPVSKSLCGRLPGSILAPPGVDFGASRETSGSDFGQNFERFTSKAMRARRSHLKPPARARSARARL